jgi:predicted RecA/RadA family phage recombinase
MANNFVQPGDIVEFTMPEDVTTGRGVLIGALVGVALVTAASGARANVALSGVFNVTKTSAEAWAEGAAVYWDDTAKEFTTTATDNTLAGHAAVAAANPSATGRIRLAS